MGVVADEALLHRLPCPPEQHQENGGLLEPRPASQDQDEDGRQQCHIDQGVPVLDVTARGQAHGGLVAESNRK